MKRSILLATLTAALAVSSVASAATPDYNYVDLGWQKVDSLSDGPAIRGGLQFGQSNFYGNAAYSRQEVNDWDVKYNLALVNIGYAHRFTEATHLNAEVGYERVSAEGESADGYRAGLGVVHAFNDHFQGLVRANHYFGGDLESDTTGTVGLTAKFTQNWGLTGEVEFADGGETYFLGARYSF